MKIYMASILLVILGLSGCAASKTTPDIESIDMHPSNSDMNTDKLQKATTF